MLGSVPEEHRETLLGVASALLRCPRPTDALRDACRAFADTAGYKSVAVLLVDEATGSLFPEAWDGLPRGISARRPVRMGEGPAGRIFETGIPLETQDGTSGAAIRSEGKTIGVLLADGIASAPESRKKSPHLVESVAGLMADYLALVRPHEIPQPERSSPDTSPTPKDRDDGFAHRLIGTSDAMRSTMEILAKLAPSDATALISGESGTGKELAARELHRLSRRAGKPFICVNCAALPESIVESELFGHEKGSFTGAESRRKGRFELADGGTLFLDEVGELSPGAQAKLLRALQERTFERVGGSETVRVDVRVVAATNRDLHDAVKAGKFREDLYFRLNVVPVRMPALRERKGDIMLLADHFAVRYAERNGKTIKRISSPAIDLLTSYHWPGNVRELENCMEHAVVLSSDMVIHSWHLPPSLQSAESTDTAPDATLEAAVARVERELIVEALKMTSGNMAKASGRLGITERQMGLRVRRYHINWRLYRKQ